MTQTRPKTWRWTPTSDVIMLRLRSAYADGAVMIVPLSQDGRDWVENKLDPVDVGTLHRVEGSIEAMAAVMRQDGLVVEVRG
jgi:hypothetical protein